GRPAPVWLEIRAKHFIEHAVILVDHENVTVPRTLAATFYGRVRGDGIRSRIALGSVSESYWDSRLRATNGDIRNTERRSLVEPSAEVGMGRAAGADPANVVC